MAYVNGEWRTVSFDGVDWQGSDDQFPSDLPDEARGTHIGMYVAWAMLNGFASDFVEGELLEGLEDLQARRITGRDFVIECCDYAFCDDLLTEECAAFTTAYYGLPGQSPPHSYFDDYVETLCADLDSVYRVEDTWENYEKIAGRISAAYADWKRSSAAGQWRDHNSKPGWMEWFR